jgi:hypothetical protein
VHGGPSGGGEPATSGRGGHKKSGHRCRWPLLTRSIDATRCSKAVFSRSGTLARVGAEVFLDARLLALEAAQDSFSNGLLDCPHYTRPEHHEWGDVPAVLLSGDHAAIRRWRLQQSLGRTWLRRPDLLEQAGLDKKTRALLDEFRNEHAQGTTPDRKSGD